MEWLEIAQAVLAIIGGLKVLARYTKADWDDKLLEKIEAPLRLVFKFLKWKK